MSWIQLSAKSKKEQEGWQVLHSIYSRDKPIQSEENPGSAGD
ncbi:MAG: hypothetical protein Q7J76_04915 [Candidatus Brocadiaceae bacterium]|nr:hypothetical protein [Candidatus Brocadiaceae bacterium]